MAALAPMPRPSVRMTVSVKPLARNSERNAYLITVCRSGTAVFDSREIYHLFVRRPGGFVGPVCHGHEEDCRLAVRARIGIDRRAREVGAPCRVIGPRREIHHVRMPWAGGGVVQVAAFRLHVADSPGLWRLERASRAIG